MKKNLVKENYLIIIIIMGLLIISTYSTYALFLKTESTTTNVVSISTVISLNPSSTEFRKVTVDANTIQTYSVVVSNTTGATIYYGVWYEMIDETAPQIVGYSSATSYSTSGTITDGTNIIVTIVANNYTDRQISFYIGIANSSTSNLGITAPRYLITEQYLASATDPILNVILGPDTVIGNYTSPTNYSQSLAAGSYKLEVWGAQGGYRSSTTYGGKGGYSYGILTLSSSKTIYIYVGGSGRSASASGSIYAGGYNGGGYRYGYYGGGGGTDMRIDGTSYYYRIIVAGGGGSDGAIAKKGMYGGGTSGGSSTESYTKNTAYCGKGGTATYSGYSTSYTVTSQATSGLNSNTLAYYAGGFGFGGGGVYLSSGYGGAGGGGWYGGAGTVPDGSGDDDRGGGGGSGFVWTSATASQVPSGYGVSSSYYLTDAATVDGNTSFTDYNGSVVTGHEGDGAARITKLLTTTVQRLNLTGISSLSITAGTTYDLTTGLTCVDNGYGCTINKILPSATTNLRAGTYRVTYYVNDTAGTIYKFNRTLTVT